MEERTSGSAGKRQNIAKAAGERVSHRATEENGHPPLARRPPDLVTFCFFIELLVSWLWDEFWWLQEHSCMWD